MKANTASLIFSLAGGALAAPIAADGSVPGLTARDVQTNDQNAVVSRAATGDSQKRGSDTLFSKEEFDEISKIALEDFLDEAGLGGFVKREANLMFSPGMFDGNIRAHEQASNTRSVNKPTEKRFLYDSEGKLRPLPFSLLLLAGNGNKDGIITGEKVEKRSTGLDGGNSLEPRILDGLLGGLLGGGGSGGGGGGLLGGLLLAGNGNKDGTITGEKVEKRSTGLDGGNSLEPRILGGLLGGLLLAGDGNKEGTIADGNKDGAISVEKFEKRNWLDDVLKVVQTLEPIIVPLISGLAGDGSQDGIITGEEAEKSE